MGIPWISTSTIRKKLLVSMVVLGIVVAVLGYSSFRGVYAYRDLVATLSSRASEIPLTTELTRSIDELKMSFQHVDIREPMEFSWSRQQKLESQDDFATLKSQRKFSEKLNHVRVILAQYKSRLERSNIDDPFLSDLSEEFEKSAELAYLLNTISIHQQDLLASGSVSHAIQQLYNLEKLSKLAHKLPTFFGDRMASFRDDVRSRYHTWIALSWSSALLAAFLLIGLIAYARIAVIKPDSSTASFEPLPRLISNSTPRRKGKPRSTFPAVLALTFTVYRSQPGSMPGKITVVESSEWRAMARCGRVVASPSARSR